MHRLYLIVNTKNKKYFHGAFLTIHWAHGSFELEICAKAKLVLVPPKTQLLHLARYWPLSALNAHFPFPKFSGVHKANEFPWG